MNRKFLIYRISKTDVVELKKYVLKTLQERKNKSSFAPAGSEIDGYPEKRGSHETSRQTGQDRREDVA